MRCALTPASPLVQRGAVPSPPAATLVASHAREFLIAETRDHRTRLSVIVLTRTTQVAPRAQTRRRSGLPAVRPAT